MKKEQFKAPGNRYKPMKLLHSFDFKNCADESDKKKVIENTIEQIKELGYGGISTNTPQNEYLKPEGWNHFDYAVKQAIYKDMRIWIYDEEGYPSGGAGGLTLKEHPEYEAKGLVCSFEKVSAGEEREIKIPYGHEKLVNAYAYKYEKRENPLRKTLYSKEEDLLIDGFKGTAVNLMKYTDDCGTVRWTAGEGFENQKAGDEYVICCYWSKRLYENTHARQNFHEARRYISVISKDAVGEFIKNTYKAYKDDVGDYFGKEIQAFFTDEPSLMSGYLDGTVTPPPSRVTVPTDDKIELYPVVTWEPFLPDEFENRYGYSLLSSLHHLYAGTGDVSVKVRYDFNKMISDLYEEAFFGQIEDFCRHAGIDFSGHVLMEEYLLHHGIWEGNIFRFMSHMDIPGIDVLTALPKEIIDMTVTPKLISSAARWFGKSHSMSEVSSFMQNFTHTPVGLAEMKGSTAAQFVMGIDTFQSYFPLEILPKDQYKLYTDFTARIGEAMDGGRDGADIILYYPIEGVQSAVKGSGKFREVREYSKTELECADSWNSTAINLMKNRLDYIMADAAAIEKLYISESEEGTVLVNLMTGNEYKAIVIPKLVGTDEKFINTLAEFASRGITVICDSLSVKTADITGKSDLKDCITDLLSMENVINVKNTEEIPEVLVSKYVPQLEIENEENCDIIYTRRSDTAAELSEVYLLVNTGKTEGEHTFIFNPGSSDFTKVLQLEPETGSVTPLKYDFTEDGRMKVTLFLGAYDTTIIGIE